MLPEEKQRGMAVHLLTDNLTLTNCWRYSIRGFLPRSFYDAQDCWRESYIKAVLLNSNKRLEVARSQHVLGRTIQRAARSLKVGSYQGKQHTSMAWLHLHFLRSRCNNSFWYFPTAYIYFSVAEICNSWVCRWIILMHSYENQTYLHNSVSNSCPLYNWTCCVCTLGPVGLRIK